MEQSVRHLLFPRAGIEQQARVDPLEQSSRHRRLQRAEASAALQRPPDPNQHRARISIRQEGGGGEGTIPVRPSLHSTKGELGKVVVGSDFVHGGSGFVRGGSGFVHEGSGFVHEGGLDAAYVHQKKSETNFRVGEGSNPDQQRQRAYTSAIIKRSQAYLAFKYQLLYVDCLPAQRSKLHVMHGQCCASSVRLRESQHCRWNIAHDSVFLSDTCMPRVLRTHEVQFVRSTLV